MSRFFVAACVMAMCVAGRVIAASPDQRADALIAQMTLDEKIQLIAGGAGGFSTHAIARLGIASFTMSDGPQGVRNGPGSPTPRACAFPCGAALAATWDPALAAAYGRAIGLEDRARGTNFQLGPGVNICRVPVNGRNFEYFGEDPFLASVMVADWVKNCSAQGSVPTVKHFAGNNQETQRDFVDARIDPRTLNEIYLPAFKAAVTSGANIAVMCSYNRLNGSYASNNDWLLNQTLKQAWGFNGLVMSDWGASHQVSDLAKGLDLEMPSPKSFSAANIRAALADGTIKQSDIDGALHRILRTAAVAGWLDAGWRKKNTALPMDSAESCKTALEVAEASIVLLKNERQTLPLDRDKIKTIVIVGPNATGDGAMPNNIGGGGSGAVRPFDRHFADADYLKGIATAAGGINIVYLPMPAAIGPEAYDALANARTAADGEAGLKLSVQVGGGGDAVAIADSVQKSVNVSWTTGHLPFGVPADRDAIFIWSGVLVAPSDGDWQVHSSGQQVISIGGKFVADGTIIHLQKQKPVGVTIKLEALAHPPVVRGRRGRGSGPVAKVALTPPMIPDVSAAKDADAAVVCVGLNRFVETEGMDRPFELPDVQQYLINAVAAVNPHTVVINNSGAAVGMTRWIDNAGAVLQAWYLGQEGGLAIGDVLFGDVNPSGHLCSTFDRTFEENPAFANYPGKQPAELAYPVEPYREGIFYGYRGYDQAGRQPLFPFGFGLSYTTFDLSNLKIERADEMVKVSMEVKNTGARRGAEVVQVYLGEENCPLPRPKRELKGFAKVMLDAGGTARVEIDLPRDAFAYWYPDTQAWTIDVGNRFTIEAGFSEKDLRLKGTIQGE